ncbi:hypothetical protein [Candidatus Galacturonibacter soehngenii]|uniref:Antigen I/II N-terminal domain-containing protein n=1 Tax=Candidatus Galacturonatibacter soehngenii TaxID=2307010 RepID=A0A7V7UBY0_9FIRM|nr:hypothetical protein [Candidatus Galacturonibacter soehngenii]KAB1438380.1 hypothetical protein F7O84_12605 [Candidatus Galacturonibacter soehngenii]
MKKVIVLVLIVCIVFTSCSTKDTSTSETEVNTQTTNSKKTETKSETESDTESRTEAEMNSEIDDTIETIGEVEVDKRLLTIEIVIPAEYMEGTSQEDLDTSSLESGFISATLNADGSATYVMTKDTHNKYMEELKTQLTSEINEMVGSTDYPNISSIEINDDYTEFNITTTSTELSMSESFSVIAFFMYGGMYNMFNGTKTDNITVNFINADSGELINTSNSANLK